MNDELKAVHMQTITHPDAVRMYDDLCAACEMREGGMTDPDQMLVADIARAEQIKQAPFWTTSPPAASGRNAAMAASATGRKTKAWRRCAPLQSSKGNISPNYG